MKSLTGVVINIDLYKAIEQDRFRGLNEGWLNAQTAISNALDAGLAVTLSLGVALSFCTRVNLDNYMQMAKNSCVEFVEMLESRGGIAKGKMLV